MEKIIKAIVSVVSKIADTPMRGYAVIVKDNTVRFSKGRKQYIVTVEEIDDKNDSYYSTSKSNLCHDKNKSHTYYTS